MLTVADILAHALALPPLDTPPVPAPDGAACALTGAPITHGHPLRPLMQKSTAVILDAVRGPLDGWVSDNAARCWRSSGPGARLALGGLAFEDGAAYQGRIAMAGRDDPARGCWRDIVRAVWPPRRGQRMAWILTTDTKKRLWTSARAGALGEATPVLLCDGDDLRSLTLSWPRLLAALDTVENAYCRGFGKPAIRDGLLSAWSQAQTWGLAEALAWERSLAEIRETPEFTVALLLAQRVQSIEPPARETTAPVPAVVATVAPTPAVASGPVQGSLWDV